MSENKNLNIWSQVKRTDLKYTKKFRRSGGFSGTAIDPLYNIHRATAMFGPMGIGWGFEIVGEQFLKGGPILANGNHEIAKETVHEIKIKLWYNYDGKRGEIFSSGATSFISKNKNGIVTDEEAVKKSLTDALSKALSWLGFSADIHIGAYDGNKHVEAGPPPKTPQDINSLKSDSTPQAQPEQKEQPAKPSSSQSKSEPEQTAPEVDEKPSKAETPAPQATGEDEDEVELPQGVPVIQGIEWSVKTGKDGQKHVVATGKGLKGKANMLYKLGFRFNGDKSLMFKPYETFQQAA